MILSISQVTTLVPVVFLIFTDAYFSWHSTYYKDYLYYFSFKPATLNQQFNVYQKAHSILDVTLFMSPLIQFCISSLFVSNSRNQVWFIWASLLVLLLRLAKISLFAITNWLAFYQLPKKFSKNYPLSAIAEITGETDWR